MTKIVTKLGGSLLNSAENIVHFITEALKSKSKIIVVSAPGKFNKRSKVTDLLIEFSENKDEDLLKLIISVFQEISKGLGVDISRDLELTEDSLRDSSSVDFILSRGEYLQAVMITAWLNKQGHRTNFIDPLSCIFLKEGSIVNYRKTKSALGKMYDESIIHIVPGFYAMGPNNEIKTFTRDGTDITGAVVSVGFEADLYNMYKDVDGFYTADPRYVESTKLISEISFGNARALAFGGSKIIHKDALIPLAENYIPLMISNPNSGKQGTLITSKPGNSLDIEPIGISDKSTFSLFHVSKRGMNDEVGFVERLLSVFKEMHISVDHIPTGIDSCAFLVDRENFPPCLKYSITSAGETIKERLLQKTSKKGTVSVDNNVAVMVIVVSDRIARFGAQVDAVFDEINIRQYTSQKLDNQIIVSLNANDLPQALSRVHEVLFGENRNTKSTDIYLHMTTLNSIAGFFLYLVLFTVSGAFVLFGQAAANITILVFSLLGIVLFFRRSIKGIEKILSTLQEDRLVEVVHG